MSSQTFQFHLAFFFATTILPGLAVASTLFGISVVYSSNPDYMSAFVVSLTPDRESINIIANVRKNLKLDPWVIVTIDTKNRTLLKYDINVCQLMARGRGNLFAKWVDTFWKFGNLPQRCPILKGNYSWKGFRIDTSLLPSAFSKRRLTLTVVVYVKKGSMRETIVTCSPEFELK